MACDNDDEYEGPALQNFTLDGPDSELAEELDSTDVGTGRDGFAFPFDE